MTQAFKCLVVDTDIASSAGNSQTQDRRSKDCREFLKAILETKHRIVTNAKIREEWSRHQSNFTSNWFASMVARRRVCWLGLFSDNELRGLLDNVHQLKCQIMEKNIQSIQLMIAKDETRREILQKDIRRIEGKLQEAQAKRKAMLKDIHLVEAALKADKIVVSLDETVRECFHESAERMTVLRTLMWVNPCRSEETPVEWLHGGAKLEKARMLGYTKENK